MLNGGHIVVQLADQADTGVLYGSFLLIFTAFDEFKKPPPGDLSVSPGFLIPAVYRTEEFPVPVKDHLCPSLIFRYISGSSDAR